MVALAQGSGMSPEARSLLLWLADSPGRRLTYRKGEIRQVELGGAIGDATEVASQLLAPEGLPSLLQGDGRGWWKLSAAGYVEAEKRAQPEPAPEPEPEAKRSVPRGERRCVWIHPKGHPRADRRCEAWTWKATPGKSYCCHHAPLSPEPAKPKVYRPDAPLSPAAKQNRKQPPVDLPARVPDPSREIPTEPPPAELKEHETPELEPAAQRCGRHQRLGCLECAEVEAEVALFGRNAKRSLVRRWT